MNLVHFKIEEFNFRGSIGYPPEDAAPHMNEGFLEMLDNARGIANIPFVISSGYRPSEYDGNVYGIPNSDHAQGCGCDIIAANDYNKFVIVSALVRAGFKRIGVNYKNNHIHVGGLSSTLPQNVLFEE